jgi:hypothetical protein
MRKQGALSRVASLLLFLGCALALGTGCVDPTRPPEDGQEKDTQGEGESQGGGESTHNLAHAVYAGPDAGGAWATFAFVKDDEEKDTVYFFPDNVRCCYGAYAYNGETKAGEISSVTTKPSVDPGVSHEAATAPGPFTLSADEKTITFGSYQGGAARSFPRRRGRGGDRSDDDPPPELPPLEAGSSLDGTVWAATAYRTRDWTTLTISAATESPQAGTIRVSHSFDCTSFPRNYADYVYNAGSNLDYIGPFKIEGNTFTFLDFYGHKAVITLRRLR